MKTLFTGISPFLHPFSRIQFPKEAQIGERGVPENKRRERIASPPPKVLNRAAPRRRLYGGNAAMRTRISG
jgi:hypothetical protein